MKLYLRRLLDQPLTYLLLSAQLGDLLSLSLSGHISKNGFSAHTHPDTRTCTHTYVHTFAQTHIKLEIVFKYF